MAEVKEKLQESEPPMLESVGQFLFQVPLYAPYRIDRDRTMQMYGRKDITIDGLCIHCGREATWKFYSAHVPGGDPWANIHLRHAIDNVSIACTRDKGHTAQFWFLINRLVVQKVGQYPSLADIANDEAKTYRKFLPTRFASEFHKAIGLAAHGVGVGSFVYLRRVFEWLIEGRFQEFKASEKWKEDEFRRMRMEDKIALLKGHLPEFLVTNRKIYSILSIGIHELGEKECLGYFDVMRRSIIMILEDDKKVREELEQRKAFEKAIADFKSPDAGQ